MQQEADDFLLEVFAQFMDEDGQANDDQDDTDTYIDMKHLPAVFNALGIEDYYLGPNSDQTMLREMKRNLDPAAEGKISFTAYSELMPLFIEQARSVEALDDEEQAATKVAVDPSTRHDFLLFTQGEDRPIELRDLQRISKEMKDNAPEELLLDMLQLHKEGSGSVGNKISVEDFEYIMKMIRSI